MWFNSSLDKTYECKHHWLGPSKDDEHSIRILNIVICWNNGSITYEADRRHVEVVIEQMQVAEARRVTSPVAREEQTKANETISDEMNPSRTLRARLHHLAIDRFDIQCAKKGASKNMVHPHLHHWSLLKRFSRYIIDAPRVIPKFNWQKDMKLVNGCGDSDWAGDQKSRKSTSGGVCMVGPHAIKTWVSTQHIIALSSAEVGFYAL